MKKPLRSLKIIIWMPVRSTEAFYEGWLAQCQHHHEIASNCFRHANEKIILSRGNDVMLSGDRNSNWIVMNGPHSSQSCTSLHHSIRLRRILFKTSHLNWSTYRIARVFATKRTNENMKSSQVFINYKSKCSFECWTLLRRQWGGGRHEREWNGINLEWISDGMMNFCLISSAEISLHFAFRIHSAPSAQPLGMPTARLPPQHSSHRTRVHFIHYYLIN